MLAETNPLDTPRIYDHARAQAFIRDWVRRYCYGKGNVAEAGVSFRQGISSCAVKILFPQDSRQGMVAVNTMFVYDLARPLTEGILHNLCLASAEPMVAWQEPDTCWKGKIR